MKLNRKTKDRDKSRPKFGEEVFKDLSLQIQEMSNLTSMTGSIYENRRFCKRFLRFFNLLT